MVELCLLLYFYAALKFHIFSVYFQRCLKRLDIAKLYRDAKCFEQAIEWVFLIYEAIHYYFYLLLRIWASSIAVRALAYCAEDHGSGPISSQWLDARSLPTQQR